MCEEIDSFVRHSLIPETTGRSLEEMDIIFGSITAEQRHAHIEEFERGEWTCVVVGYCVLIYLPSGTQKTRPSGFNKQSLNVSHVLLPDLTSLLHHVLRLLACCTRDETSDAT